MVKRNDKEINEFENNWQEWTIENTVSWFKYVLLCSSQTKENDTMDTLIVGIDVDFDQIEHTLKKYEFVAKVNLAAMDMKAFDKLGFRNTDDCTLIFNKTRQLVTKYPKIK